LKGAAGNVSAFELMSAAKSLEEAAAHENKNQIMILLQAVDEAFKKVLTSLEHIHQKFNMT
jgi:hypothetical protein